MSRPVKFEAEFEVKCVFHETHTLTDADVRFWARNNVIYPNGVSYCIDCEELTDDEVNLFVQFLNDNYDKNKQMKLENDLDEPYYIDEPSSFGQNYSKEEEGLPQSVQDTLENYWDKFLGEHQDAIVKRVMKKAEEQAAKELKEAEERVEREAAEKAAKEAEEKAEATFSIDIMTSYKTLLKAKDEELKSLYKLVSELEKELAKK